MNTQMPSPMLPRQSSSIFDPIHDCLDAIKRRLDEDRMQRRGALLEEWDKLTLESVGDTDIEKEYQLNKVG